MNDIFRKEYTPLNEEQKAQVAEIKDKAMELLEVMGKNSDLDETTERSTCHTEALRHLKEAVMWSVRGVTSAKEE